MITLNSNTGSNQILLRLTPNRQYLESEDNSIKVPVVEIVDIKIVNVGGATGVDKKSLVSIKTNLYRITLVGKENKHILSFFSDSQSAFDGLTMMLGKGSVSEETTKQIDTLIEIRSKTQLLDLNEIDDSDDEEDEADEDADEVLEDLLEVINEDFYYK